MTDIYGAAAIKIPSSFSSKGTEFSQQRLKEFLKEFLNEISDSINVKTRVRILQEKIVLISDFIVFYFEEDDCESLFHTLIDKKNPFYARTSDEYGTYKFFAYHDTDRQIKYSNEFIETDDDEFYEEYYNDILAISKLWKKLIPKPITKHDKNFIDVDYIHFTP